KRYYDRFHFLLGRFVMSLRAFKDRMARAAQLGPLGAEIESLKEEIKKLDRTTTEYHQEKKRLHDLLSTRQETARGVAGAYRDLQPAVPASPFISTSTSALLAARYSLG